MGASGLRRLVGEHRQELVLAAGRRRSSSAALRRRLALEPGARGDLLAASVSFARENSSAAPRRPGLLGSSFAFRRALSAARAGDRVGHHDRVGEVLPPRPRGLIEAITGTGAARGTPSRVRAHPGRSPRTAVARGARRRPGRRRGRRARGAGCRAWRRPGCRPWRRTGRWRRGSSRPWQTRVSVPSAQGLEQGLGARGPRP